MALVRHNQSMFTQTWEYKLLASSKIVGAHAAAARQPMSVDCHEPNFIEFGIGGLDGGRYCEENLACW